MSDFGSYLIMTRKSTRQFRDILNQPFSQEYYLRRILLGAMKEATVIKKDHTSQGERTTYGITLKTPSQTKIQVTIVKNSKKKAKDGKMTCSFVTNVTKSRVEHD